MNTGEAMLAAQREFGVITGADEIDDGTGRIYVVATGGGVPRQGATTKAKGRFESVFSLLGRTLANVQ